MVMGDVAVSCLGVTCTLAREFIRLVCLAEVVGH